MPQVDLSSVCGAICQDQKVACETLAGDGDGDSDDYPAPAEIRPDYAPESFWLSKDAEFDWLDRNAFLDRKDSGKGSLYSVSNSTNSNPNFNPISVNSQRYSVNLKSNALIIGLSKPPNNKHRHCRQASVRLFPKRSEPVSGRLVVGLSEPSSPKVSCIGRVRSRKDRSHRGKNRKKQTEPVLVKSKSVKQRKTGFWKNFRSMFRSKAHKQMDYKGNEDVVERKSSKSKKKRGFNSNVRCDGSSQTTATEPPGLGAVKRFASGHRSDGWAGVVEVDGAKSEPLDCGPIWRRRVSDPPGEVDVERDWRVVGPASA